MFFVPVLFWLSSVFQDFLVYLFPLCFWFLVYENPKKTERPFGSFGVIHVCLVGANVILKLLFGSFSRCSTTFLLGFPFSCVFFLFSFSFPVFPCPKSRRCCTAQETEATQDDSLSGASGGLAVSKIETIIDSPKKCVWTGWVHLHLTKLCIV